MTRRLDTFWPPALFGLVALCAWQMGVAAFHVPRVILPAPSAIFSRLFGSLPTLWLDFLQTMQGVAAGYVVGCASGLTVVGIGTTRVM